MMVRAAETTVVAGGEPPAHAPRIRRTAAPDGAAAYQHREAAGWRWRAVSGVQSLIDEIEASFRGGSASRRATTLRRITDLFMAGADSFQERQIGLFDDILCLLISKIEREAIIELSRTVAPVGKAPPALTRKLSRHNDIEISGPVLRQSPLLTDGDLIEIAQSKSQQHLEAIAARREVSEKVSDVLIDRGNTDVLTAVAGNFGARFSPNGYNSLLAKAEDHADIAMAVVIRSDLSPEMFRKLVGRAATTVQQRLLTIANPAVKERLQNVLQDISLQLVRDADVKTSRFDMHRPPEIKSLDKSKLRSELLGYANAGRLAESATALATISGVPADTIRRLIAQRETEALLIVCKAGELGWSTVKALLNLSAITHGAAKANPLDYLDQYTKMTVESAKRVIRFLNARKSVSEAELRKMLAS